MFRPSRSCVSPSPRVMMAKVKSASPFDFPISFPQKRCFAERASFAVDVTANHLMVVESKGTIPASEVRAADKMRVARDSRGTVEATVTAVNLLATARQVRLVMTQAGTIVVNGVVASSLEDTGSGLVGHLLRVGQSLAGDTGLQVARSVTQFVGEMVTSGDAVTAASA